VATFTHLDLADATRIARAHGLGGCHAVLPIAAGTVNSNYFLDTDQGRVFVRLYEQQESEGVAYEWLLLSHLRARGVPLPARVEGPPAGQERVAGRPVAVFRRVEGEDLCQARVDTARTRAVGAALARANRAGQDFTPVREGRFRLADIEQLIEAARGAERAELSASLARLGALAAELGAALAGELRELPRGVIHGDLFRDNVLWQDGSVVALLDWESASDGILVYDLAVTLLAWCCGDRLDWQLARAMVDGYRGVRELSGPEWTGLWWMLRLACLRFATTRITDVFLKGGYPPGYKDYRRFLLRLDAVEAFTPEVLARTLGG
jgi:homoserine kinase type II